MPEIRLHDQPRTIKENFTLESLVRGEYPERGNSMVAAVNDEVIPPSRWAQTLLQQGDDVLIFMPVKGGFDRS